MKLILIYWNSINNKWNLFFKEQKKTQKKNQHNFVARSLFIRTMSNIKERTFFEREMVQNCWLQCRTFSRAFMSPMIPVKKFISTSLKNHWKKLLLTNPINVCNFRNGRVIGGTVLFEKSVKIKKLAFT